MDKTDVFLQVDIISDAALASGTPVVDPKTLEYVDNDHQEATSVVILPTGEVPWPETTVNILTSQSPEGNEGKLSISIVTVQLTSVIAENKTRKLVPYIK